MAQEKLRVAIVGATPGRGWGPRAHIPTYQTLPELELAAVCTARPESAQAAAAEFGVPKHYSDYRELVQSPDIDVVSVVTRIPLHYPISKAALEAGKHVFCEWPLTVTSQQAAELDDLARRKGLRAITGLQSRFSPTFLHMKGLLEEGYIGQPLTFNMTMFLSGALGPRPSYYAFTAQKESGAGVVSIACGHATDTLCWLLGDIQALSAQVSTQIGEWTLPDTKERVAVTTPDNVGYMARLKSGAVGTVQMSNTAAAGSGFRLEVYGTGGKLAAVSAGMLELSWVRLLGARSGEEEAELPIPEGLTWVSGLPMDGAAFNIAQLFRRFAEAIHQGRDLAPTFDDAARTHRLLEAMDRSSETKRWVTPD